MQDAYGLLVDNDGTSAAQGLAAAKLGAGQSDFVTQKPEQRKVGSPSQLCSCPLIFTLIMIVPRSF